jgi:vitamin K-dependent gamma-carboxylase
MSWTLNDTATSKTQNDDEALGMRRLRERLFEPVDIASIAVFRMLFGAILFWEVWRFFDNDWIRKFYIVRKFHFKYFGFEWVHPWPGDGMYVHFVAVGVLALCVMTGFLYRITSWLLFLGFTYWFLLDQTRYLNHLYLAALLAFLLAVIPAHRANSFDVRVRPTLRSQTIPTWCLWLLRAQVGLVYIYAGIAKLNGDWLRGEPIRQWLASRNDYPLIGSWLDTEVAVWFFAYGGVLFDLLVIPALLWRKTRAWAFAACVAFHVINMWLFDIGIFPVLMLAATLLMFPPDWPRKVVLFFTPQQEGQVPTTPLPPSKPHQRLTMIFLASYLSLQLLIPLRHVLYPGNVHWTEEGHRFSWHMKLRQKLAEVHFYATDPMTGETWEVDHRQYLSTAQSKRVGRWPDMCLQFAHFLATELQTEEHAQVEIRVRTKASLNGRESQYLIDPEVDLSKEPRTPWHAGWILPLEKPLPVRND